MNSHHIVAAAAALRVSFTSLVGVQAQPVAIGFGWESNVAQETVYSVDLTTGQASVIGALPGLSSVRVGSHGVDYPTAASVIIGTAGSSSAQSLFLFVPAKKAVYTFALSGLDALGTFQRALIRPSDGALLLLTASPSLAGTVSIYQAELDLNAVAVHPKLLGSAPVSSYSIDSAHISHNGTISFATGDNPPQLVTFDTVLGTSQTVSLNASGISALFACSPTDSTSRLFALANLRSDGGITQNLAEIVNGSLVTASTLTGVTAFLAGSSSCRTDTLRLLGRSDDRGSTEAPEASAATGFLYSYRIDQDFSFSALPLSVSTINILEEVSPSTALAAELSATATGSLRLVSRLALKRCLSNTRAKVRSTKKLTRLTVRKAATSLTTAKFKNRTCIG